MNADQIQKAADQREQHRRKTCAAGPDYRSGDGADRDAEYEARHVRGADACHCGGSPAYLPGGTLGNFATVKAAIQCRACPAMTISEGGMAELIAEWNKGVARRKFLQSAIDAERAEHP